ncbi:MAG: hypothetical protein RR893_12660, partial [Clostridia bacterium]
MKRHDGGQWDSALTNGRRLATLGILLALLFLACPAFAEGTIATNVTLKEEYVKSIAVRGMQLIDVREYVTFTGVDADVWPDNTELVYEEQNPTVIYIGMVKPWLCKSDYYGGTQTVKLALNNGTTDQKIIELPFTVKGANTASTSFIGLREKTHF